MALRLPVLDWTPTQVFVHLGDIYGCRALLVHSGGLSDPVVDVSRLLRALALTYLVREFAGKRCVRTNVMVRQLFC